MIHNIRVLLGMQLCLGMQFFLPVFYLFLRENNLSWKEVFVLEGIFTFSIMIFQLPAGIAADRYGCKPVLVTSFVAGAISMTIFGSSHCFAWFVVGEILFGLLVACQSAGMESIAYASLLEADRAPEFRRTLGNLMCVSLGGLSLTGILGGLTAMISLRLTLWLTAPAFALGALLALSLREPAKHGERHVSLGETLSAICEDGWTLRTVILTNVAFLSVITAITWLGQPYQLSIGVEGWVIGAVQAGALLVASVTSKFTHRLEHLVDDRILLLGTFVIVASSLVIMTFVGGFVGIIFLIVARGCFGAITTLGSDLLHRLIENRIRSRVQALQGTILRGFTALACLGVGVLLDGPGLSPTLLVITLSGGLAMILTLTALHAAWPRSDHQSSQ